MKKASTINTPHDRLFRNAMKDMRVAKEFFEQYLPSTVRDAVDLNSLVLCPNSYIDQTLKLSASDVLYQVNLNGKQSYLYLLCEHQSTPDRFMSFRLWKYIIAIWDDHLKQIGNKTKTLPLIVPLVFYTGSKPYNSSTDLRDLIHASPMLIDQILFQPFHLVDVNNIPDKRLREHLWAGVMAFVMKHIRARNALSFLQKVRRQLHKLELENGAEHVILLLNYFIIASENTDQEKFAKLIQAELSPNVGENIMTLAEQYIETGYKRGLIAAKQKQVALLIRLLTRKFGIISADYQQRIHQADADMLLLWNEQILDANTLEEVFYSSATL